MSWASDLKWPWDFTSGGRIWAQLGFPSPETVVLALECEAYVLSVSSDGLPEPSQWCMSESELVLAGKHAWHGQDDPVHADFYDCRDFEQSCADGATGRLLQAGLPKGHLLQGGEQDIGGCGEPHPETDFFTI